MSNILSDILNLFTAGPNTQQFPPAPAPAQQQAPAPLPQQVPIPTPAPRPQLPGGTFTPNRQDAPQQMPVPQQRPEPPPPPPANPMIPDNMAQSQNPLMALLSGTGAGGGRSIGDMIASAGAGMAAIDPRNDDPMSTLGKGMSGASGYYTDQNKIRNAQEMEKQRLAQSISQDSRNFDYKVGQDGIDNKRSDAEMALRQAAEGRNAKSSALTDQKTAAEIARLAKSNGLTVDQQLDIEKMAQKAGDDLFGADKKAAIEETRKRLMEQYSTGQPLSAPALSNSTGALSGEQTATGPNGEKIVLRNGQWVSQ